MGAFAHERFSREVKLSPEAVGAYALSIGDDNPMHHDSAFAADTRFGRLIASGAHTAALLIGLTASHYSRRGAMVGLEFSVRFRRAIFADETIVLEWLAIKVAPNAKLGGEVVHLRGRILNQRGETAIDATGRVLVTRRL